MCERHIASSNPMSHADQKIAPHQRQHAPQPRPPLIDSSRRARCSTRAVAALASTVTVLEMEAVCNHLICTLLDCTIAIIACS